MESVTRDQNLDKAVCVLLQDKYALWNWYKSIYSLLVIGK